MRIITVKIPESYLEGLEELVNIGRYSSRSEAIRAAIRDLLKKELWDMESSKKEREENDEDRIERRGRIVRVTI
jgi:Arc/MetJ-type ribon-helix-helix transcriptional regulator